LALYFGSRPGHFTADCDKYLQIPFEKLEEEFWNDVHMQLMP
jgi:hypothetical protein